MRHRKLTATVLTVGALAVSASPALAGSFGPGNKGGGNGNSGPQVGKCHPPGQTTTTPGCK